MSVMLVVQLGMFALAGTVLSLMVLGPSNSSPKSVWSLETSLDPTEETSIMKLNYVLDLWKQNQFYLWAQAFAS